jgi:hypothetical protein
VAQSIGDDPSRCGSVGRNADLQIVLADRVGVTQPTCGTAFDPHDRPGSVVPAQTQ